MKKDRMLMAAIAGITLGVSGGAVAGDAKKDEVKCYGINGCGSHAKCAVGEADLAAVKALLGDADYKKRFGNSEVHSCGSHAKCGGSDQILNWVPTTAGECKAKGGLLIEEDANKKKVAKKA